MIPDRRVSPAAIFERAGRLEALPETLRLRAAEWSLLLAITGRHGLGQIGAVLGLDPATRDAAAAVLLDRGLIVERAVRQAEFLAARAAVPADEPVPLAQFLSAPSFVPLEATGAEEPMIPPNPESSPRRLSLRALMAFLTEGAASPEAGQMNIYRLFIRLDPESLRRNGIKTLRFEDDRVIEDPELQDQILAAVESTFGRPCPARVFL